MASTLYSMLQGGNPPTKNQLNNASAPDIMTRFNEFSKTVSNPKAEVERLLQSGKMSQQQFNMLANMANNMFGRR